MTDWADGIEIRNNGIKCVIDAHVLSELLRNITALGMIAGALLFYSWIRSQIVYAGYESQRLHERELSLLDDQKNLILTYETLTNPQRIYMIATRDLGMGKLRPNQMILPPLKTGDRGIPSSLAMAGSEENTLEKSGGNKRFGNYSKD